jgi:hypothetical protein
VYSSLDIVFQFFRRDCLAAWHVLFEYGNEDPDVQEELATELEWSRSRGCSRMHGQDRVDLMSLQNPFVETFSEMELRHLTEYMIQNPNGCYQMNQNILGGHGVMSGLSRSGIPVLYTLVSSPAFHYSNLHKRWASGNEMLLSLGFPVKPRFANVRGSPARCCSFCPGGVLDESEPTRVRNKKVSFAGNSQNVAVNVFMKLYVLLFASRIEQHPIAQVFRP